MHVIGVLDLLHGRAVHARAGQRDQYRPVSHAAGLPIDGDALTLARVYRDRFGLSDLYAADLDAIAERPWNDRLIEAIAGIGALWLDAGVTAIDRAQHALDLGASRVIIGLETLQSWQALADICSAVGGRHLAFSLDLDNGHPRGSRDVVGDAAPPVIAARAAEAGVHSLIVIDLARVGTGSGVDLPTIASVRTAVPDVSLVAGGGVRSEDLPRLMDAGCNAVLMATALQDGSYAKVSR